MFFSFKFIYLLLWNFIYYFWFIYFLKNISSNSFNYLFYFFILFWMVGLLLIVWGVNFNSEISHISYIVIIYFIFLFLTFNCGVLILSKEMSLMNNWNSIYSSFPFLLLIITLELLVFVF